MNRRRLASLITLSALVAACQSRPHGAGEAGQAAQKPKTAADAQSFIERVNADLKELWTEWSRAEWIKSTYIIDDSELIAARANERQLAYAGQAIKEAASFNGVEVDPAVRRQLDLLRRSQTMPAPSDAAKRKELTELAAKMEGLYGKGEYCGDDKKGPCRDLGQLSKVIAESRDYDATLEAWRGWHGISPPMRPMYQRFVELTNEGAREIGFANLAELWKSNYDMAPDAFEAETDRLWSQVKPLYDQLHCEVRAKLSKHYGAEKVPPGGLIPAHLLGNMWAQEWANVYPLVEPYKGQASIDVTKALVKAKYDPMKMVKTAEGFFTSLGLDPLPQTFWERSMFVQPKDRKVVCHASAWDVTFSNDLRLKMCIKIDAEDLITVHHELGHHYYFMYYHTLPVLFQNGANDGFHEAIGDAVALSITPGYLKMIGVLGDVPKNEKNLINLQMQDALEKIAFLPFGKLIDQWRWDVFSGKTAPADYNKAWWTLREKYQGIKSAVERTEADFDPAAKYHVPANVPYTRYFLARVLQFQFHKAMCQAAGHTGPLHECSVYGNRAAGEKLEAMLRLGQSKPWPEALEAMTGSRDMDASALVEYFQPLMKYLEEQNKDRKCGW